MSTMDDDTELRDMLIQNLEKNGTLAKLRAQLRASVFLALEDQEKVKNKAPLLNDKVQKFVQSSDGRLCCELVIDLMNSLNLDASELVFQPEISLKDVRSRDEVAKALNLSLSAEDRTQPLLAVLLRNSRQPNATKSHEPAGKIVDAFSSKSSKLTNQKNADFEDDEFRSVGDDDDFFGESSDSKFKYSIPGINTVTQRPKPFDKEPTGVIVTKGSVSSVSTDKKSSNDKLGSESAEPTKDSKSSGKGSSTAASSGSMSFLGDLPDITRKSAFPPLNMGGDVKKSVESNSIKTQNLMKILDGAGSFDDSPRLSTASIDSPKSPIPTKLNGPKSTDPVAKPNDKSKDAPKSASIDKKESNLHKSESAEDEISEEIVEDLDVDDLLSSARSGQQLSF